MPNSNQTGMTHTVVDGYFKFLKFLIEFYFFIFINFFNRFL